MQTMRIERPDDLAQGLEELGLAPPRPTVVVAGGACNLSDHDAGLIEPALADLAGAADRVGAAIVDGGTDAGVMRILGRARAQGHRFPLVGVVVDSLAAAPGTQPDGEQATLEPNHSHAVLVPGADWGDEVPWLVRVADALAAGAPSMTVLANGGDVAFADAAASVKRGRIVLTLDGSGRTADALAAAARGEPADERARAVAASGLVHVFDLREDEDGLAAEVERLLARGS
jgi:hypothetical protein